MDFFNKNTKIIVLITAGTTVIVSFINDNRNNIKKLTNGDENNVDKKETSMNVQVSNLTKISAILSLLGVGIVNYRRLF